MVCESLKYVGANEEGARMGCGIGMEESPIGDRPFMAANPKLPLV